MEENSQNKNDKTEDIRMVNDFRDELERIKQKLASDFSKYSEIDKIKNKKKLNNINQPQVSEKHNENEKEKGAEKIFLKIPTMEELKIKYGLIPKNNISSETETNVSNNNKYPFITKIDPKKLKNDNLRNNKIINNYNTENQKKNYINSSLNSHNITSVEHNEFRKKYINMDNDNKQDINFNMSFKNNNFRKLEVFKTDINEDYDKHSYINRDKRKIESPNRLNDNSNSNTSLILNSKLDQQIKLINEKSENNRLEEEKTQVKIRQIEDKLQLDERLTHNNREIRKNAVKELSDMCQSDFNTNEDRQKAFDYFSPWVKYCLEETNSYVISDCLNFFIIFNSLFPSFLTNSMKDFFDNVERFISFGIFSINESCIKIFFMLFNDKKLYNQTFNELLKLLIKSSSASIKIIKFIQELISFLFEKNILQENYVKILFEKIIYIYSNINIKNIEKKKIFEKLIKNIYFYIDDDYETIRKYIKLNSYKDLDLLFKKINSSNIGKNMITFNLYPRPIQTEIENNNNINDLFGYNRNANDRLLTEKDNMKYNSIYGKNILNKTPEKRNNNLQVCINGEVNDIISVLPNQFFEYHLAVQFQSKMQILEKSNEILNKIKFVKDKSKNLLDVYKAINYSIEDSNILIHLEGIKLLENVCRLINEFISEQKLKLLLETCFEKLKDKKSIIKNELFNLFNIIIEYQCFEVKKFISFVFHFCSNEKNDNSNIKLGLFEYIKSLFFQENLKIQKQIHCISEKEYLYHTKTIVNIIQKESLSLVKDLCSDLLIIFKRRINSQRTFYELIDDLPNFRKKIINEGGKVEMNEINYKKNLRQIKSSYSFSNIKKGNRNNRSMNNLNISNSNSSALKNDSFYSNNNYNKINIKTLKNSKLNSNRNSRKNQSFTKLNISFNNSPQKKIRDKIIRNGNENNFINMTEIGMDNGCENNKNNNKSNNNKNSDNLKERKNALLKSIENINEDTIEKYSKIIIKDFLTFVKKVCKQKNEDLSTHFELIFMINEKIFNRIIFFMNENKNIKQNISKFKKLLDELINYLTKILILTPGIQQIKGSSKFNLLIFEKYLSMFLNFSFNKEKYYMYILLNLYKLCEGKDDDFPKNFDSKNSVLFFLKYVKKGNMKINSKKILNILKEFIAETKILSLSEKAELLEGIDLDGDVEVDKKNLIENKEKNDAEEINIILDKEKNNDNGFNGNKLLKENKIKNNNEEKNLHNKKDDLISEESNLNLPLKTDEDITISKLKKNDLDKIEQSIKLMSNRLNSTNPTTKEDNKIKLIENSKEKDNQKNQNNEIPKNKNKVLDNNEIKKNMNALNIPLSILKNKLTLNNSKKLSLKLNTVNKSNLNTSKDKINSNKNNVLKDNENKNFNNNISTENNTNDKTYLNILNEIIKTLKNESTEEDIFNKAILQFLKLSSMEQKYEYINTLQKSLENPIFLKNTSINTFLNFYDYILSLLSLEILKFSNEESVIIKFQTLSLYLLNFRKTEDMFKVMLFLLKKYFPKDLNKKIEGVALVIIKIIAFILKELLKNIKQQKINGRDIICEINDLFSNTPPSTLTTLTPNCNFYQNIFTLLKSITDEIALQNKKELVEIIQFLQEKKIVCNDYIQYLIRLNSTFK